MKHQRIVGIPLLAGFLFMAPWAAQTEEVREVISTGTGSIVGGDVAHARDDAIEDALRRGIEQVLGTLVESETLVENFQLIEDQIMTKTRGYVQQYQILSEGKREGTLYEVTVRALLKVGNIQDDLEGIRTLMRRKNMPRLMVLIEEVNVGETPGAHLLQADLNTAETALMNFFMGKGFRFVDQTTVKRNLDRRRAEAIVQGDVAQASALGKAVGAEVVLSGKAVAKATVTEAFGAQIRSQQATVTVRAIRTDTGDIIATATGQGAHPHIDDLQGGVMAIQKACDKLASPLLNQVLERWQSEVSGGEIILLYVEGITDYSQLGRLKNGLPYWVRGLQSVNQRSFADGHAVFEVLMKGSADDLAQRLSGKDLDGMQLRVVGLTQNSLTVRLLSGQPEGGVGR